MESVKDEMASDLETYLELCPPESDPTLLKDEVQIINHDYEEMIIDVSVRVRVHAGVRLCMHIV